MDNLPANQRNEWTPSLREREARADHREWIGGRAVTLLNHYWRDDDPAEMTGAIGKDWADVLEGISRDAITKACIQYQRDEARRKPTPGAIYQLALGFMPRPALVRQPPAPEEPKEPPCDPDVAQALCEAAGYTPKRFGGNDQ